MFIDLHCHILPSIDDGADSISESLEIISGAYNTGTTVMVATPHSNNNSKCPFPVTRAGLNDAYKSLTSIIADNNISVKLFLGAELQADENLEYLYRTNEIVTINGSRYVLVEFYFDEDIRNVYKYTDQLLSMGFVPIIAHPERYDFFDDTKSDIYKLLNMGCKIQINKGSPLGSYGRYSKELALWMLNNDFVHLIASDCHSASRRNADMSELYVWMLDKFSQNRINGLLHDNPKRILLDMNI